MDTSLSDIIKACATITISHVMRNVCMHSFISQSILLFAKQSLQTSILKKLGIFN